ncbi:MAG: hypothetical protein QM541_08575 [Flavobacterium sp.]|nr:hypothetical protein [Flavobacterium sp.]
MKRRVSFKWYLYAMGIAFLLSNCLDIFDVCVGDTYTLTIPVKTKDYVNIIADKVLKSYETVSIYQNNTVIKITNPSIWQRIFWPNIDGQDLIIQVCWIIIAICYLWILILIKNDYQPFEVNLSTPLFIAALIAFITAFYASFRKHYLDTVILRLTNNEFGYDKYGHQNYSYLIWIGVFLFIALNWYKKGYKLQKEQDFTI